jgi:undecaprenyl-diphosphatase
MSTQPKQEPLARAPDAPPGTPPSRPPGPVLAVLRWVGLNVKGFYGAVGVFLIIGLVLILIAGVAFAHLAEEVAEGETQAFDHSVMVWMGEHGSPTLTILAQEVTALGSGMVVWMVILVASAFLWGSKHRYSVALLWVAMLGAGIISSALKAFYDRPRPDVFPWRVPYAGEASFPSGHSMTAMVGYATLAYLIARLEPSAALRRLTFGVAGVVIVAIGLSRMYVGVHWPSDVLGGFAMGLAWAAFAALGMEAIRYFRMRKPGVEEAERDLDAEKEREMGVRE